MRVLRLVIFGTVVLAPQARADHTSLHATATGEVATTDNLFAAGSDGDRQADLFFTIRPGLLFAWDEPRMIHDFTGEAEVTEYILHSERPSVSGRGGWRGLFLVGPRSELAMSINTGTGVLSSLASRTSSDETTATVTPPGKLAVDQVDAAQSLSWISGKHTRVLQGLVGRYTMTNDGAGRVTESREVGGNLGFERSFEHDTVTLDASVSYVRLQGIALPGDLIGNRFVEQVNPRGLVLLRHDFDREWSANAEGGVVFVNPIGDGPMNVLRRAGTFGVYGGQLAYTETMGRVWLTARRTVAPNLYMARNTVDDQVNLQVALPLPWFGSSNRRPELVGLGSAGVGRTQAIDADTSALDGDIRVAHLDATLAWSPKPGVTYGARYELVYQSKGTDGLMTLPAYYRNTLLFTFALRYPDRLAADVPRRTKSMRSDRKDVNPVGTEPFSPDVFDQAEGADRR